MKKQIRLENNPENIEVLQKIDRKIFKALLKKGAKGARYSKIKVNSSETHVRIEVEEVDDVTQCITDECPELTDLTDEGWKNIKSS